MEEGSTYKVELAPELSKEMGLRTYFIIKKNWERARTDGQRSATASMSGNDQIIQDTIK